MGRTKLTKWCSSILMQDDLNLSLKREILDRLAKTNLQGMTSKLFLVEKMHIALKGHYVIYHLVFIHSLINQSNLSSFCVYIVVLLDYANYLLKILKNLHFLYLEI